MKPLNVKGLTGKSKTVNFCATETKIFDVIDTNTPLNYINFDPDDSVLWLCSCPRDSFMCDGIIVPRASECT